VGGGVGRRVVAWVDDWWVCVTGPGYTPAEAAVGDVRAHSGRCAVGGGWQRSRGAPRTEGAATPTRRPGVRAFP